MPVEDLIKAVPSIDPKIEDWLEKRMQSFDNKNVGLYLDMLEKHREHEIESREIYRKELTQQVAEATIAAMKLMFNGKMDKMDERWKKIEPVVNAFESKQNFKKEGVGYLKTIAIVASGIVGLKVITEFLQK